jgi:transposase InsO family protein/DNA-binding CsgD family transcriptional regulator
MAKLTQKKINWIIKQKENRVSSSEIARIMNITPRYVNMIYRKFRLEGNVELKNPGRKKDPISEEMKTMVYETRKEHPGSGALSIEKNLKERGVKISHNKIHEILKEGGMVMENMNKKKQRKWVRWEREHSNSLWHMDWFEYEEKNYIVIEDASRFIIQFGEYEHATAENSLDALRKGIEKYGKPREVMTDHGTQFTSLPRDEKESEPNEFQKYLEENGIVHIKARVKHPQSNGKLERLIFTLKDLKKYFGTWEEVVNYYNYKRMHMSLYKDRIITPAMAYEMKKLKEGEGEVLE